MSSALVWARSGERRAGFGYGARREKAPRERATGGANQSLDFEKRYQSPAQAAAPLHSAARLDVRAGPVAFNHVSGTYAIPVTVFNPPVSRVSNYRAVEKISHTCPPTTQTQH